MSKGRKIGLVIVSICMALGITGLVAGIVNAAKKPANTIELEETNQIIVDGDGNTDITSADDAFYYLVDNAASFGISNPEDTLSFEEENTAAGTTFYHFRQTYQGIKVYGNRLNVSADAQDGTLMMTSAVYEDIDEDIDLHAEATKEDVVSGIETYLKKEFGEASVAAVEVGDDSLTDEHLVIYPRDDKDDVLAYELDAIFQMGEGYENYHFLVDAHTGDVLDGWSNIMAETVSVKAGGKDVEIEVDYNEDEQMYYLYDKERNIWIYDWEGKISREKYIENGKEKERFTGQGVEIKNKDKYNWPENAKLAMWDVAQVYDRYRELLGIEGWDNKNGGVLAFVNDGWSNGDNGYSIGVSLDDGTPATLLSFGKNNDLSKTMDLVAHEYSHSVQNAIVSLNYEEDSGAIMESYADTMGEIIEGDLLWFHKGSAASKGRDIADPNTLGYPSKIGGKYCYPDNKKTKQDRVHQDCTIMSHASYLMVAGIDGDASRSLNDLQVATLWYLSLGSVSKSNINFQEFGTLMYKTAENMVKRNMLKDKQLECVEDALTEVGIKLDTLITVNQDTAYIIKDFYGDYLDDATVEFYEMELNDDGKYEIILGKEPVKSFKTAEEAKADVVKLESGKAYAIRITDNKYSEDGEYWLYVKCKIRKAIDILNISTNFRIDVVKDFAFVDDEIDIAIDEIKYPECVVKPFGMYNQNWEITWESSDPSVATVADDGDIKGISEGTAVITATLANRGNEFKDILNVTVTKKQRDTILVLDCSGSMSGTPMSEMKEAAVKFCETILNSGGDNYIEIIGYDSGTYKSGFLSDLSSLQSYIYSMSAGSMTNMHSALTLAESELQQSARKSSVQSIVVMSDGVPNDGKSQSNGVMTQWCSSSGQSSYGTGAEYGNAICTYYDGTLKPKYDVYSLGFFHDLYGVSKDYCSYLMQYIQNQGYREVVDASNLQVEFGAISSNVKDGSKIVIVVACPVDVSVTSEGETLSSSRTNYKDSADFGTLKVSGVGKDIKILELDSTKEYDIQLSGTGNGTMDYAVTYYNADDRIEESRTFSAVPIAANTAIFSNTSQVTDTALNIDSDGDGQIDSIWTASADSEGKEIFTDQNAITANVAAQAAEDGISYSEEDNADEEHDNKTVWIVLIICSSVIIIVSLTCMVILLVKKESVKSDADHREVQKRQANGTPSVYGVLVILDGTMRNQQLSLENNKLYTLGKDSSRANIVLDSTLQNVSRVHCTVEFDAKHNGYYVTDQSSNGTYLMNSKKRLERGQRTLLARGTVIYLANENCRVNLD